MANKVGRPRKKNAYVKTISVIVSEEEYLAVQLISIKLGYTTTSSFLRSAITKGIMFSCNGPNLFTFPKDKPHWEYLGKVWSYTDHLKENADFTKHTKTKDTNTDT
jgi:hypothetical protein